MALYPKLIHDALATVRYPGTGKNLIEAEMVEDDLRIDGQKVSFSLIFEKPTDPFMKSILKASEAAIKREAGADVEVTISVKTIQQARPEVEKLLPQVKNIIAVYLILGQRAILRIVIFGIYLWDIESVDVEQGAIYLMVALNNISNGLLGCGYLLLKDREVVLYEAVLLLHL